MAQKNSHAARKKGGVWKILLVLVVLLALAVGGALLFAHNEISGNRVGDDDFLAEVMAFLS